ncbi:hypothetical protein ZOSMA_78G00730 [Zostera marina]|uniref:Dirigent protein n=1 Tax=Zostera marina TaxID=29655 RepID=A0A0K9NQE4_ZOSMR|nr:hypothetical protein ZOSMA_78G00730 [Zostera marina]
MAKLSAISILLIFFTISSTSLISSCYAQEKQLVIEEKTAPKLGKPIQTHLRFYLNENFTGPDPTTVKIAEAASINASTTLFSQTYTFDNVLTLDPDTPTDVIGRAQGFYSFSAKETLAVTILTTMIFDDKRFNGSSLIVSGRIDITAPEREIPVIGGSGVFRYATGYCKLVPYYINQKTFDNIILYNVYVTHY